MARCYPGTVMLEGTTLSEGRGTTRPLELFGAPDIDAAGIVAEAMVALVVAEAVLEKFGGDSVAETRRNVEGYLGSLRYR